MIRYLLPIMAALVVAPTQANACAFLPRPVEEVVSEIATDAVMIRGTVIQPFDAEKRLPEIIRADTIYIGEGGPQDFVIDRPDRDYRIALGEFQNSTCAYPSSDFITGEAVDRLILLPSGQGRWRVCRCLVYFSDGRSFNSVNEGGGLDLLVNEATRLGRFQSRPPRDARWRD
jgi:hypothetical protein